MVIPQIKSLKHINFGQKRVIGQGLRLKTLMVKFDFKYYYSTKNRSSFIYMYI